MTMLAVGLACLGLAAQAPAELPTEPAAAMTPSPPLPGLVPPEAAPPPPTVVEASDPASPEPVAVPDPVAEPIPAPVSYDTPRPFEVGRFTWFTYPPELLGVRIGTVADYTTSTYGWDEEKIRLFAVSFRGKPDHPSTMGAVRNVMGGQLRSNGKDMNLPTGRLVRTRMADDRCIVLCCINDSRSRGPDEPELFCIVVRLERGRFIAYGLMPEKSNGTIRFLGSEDECPAEDECEGDVNAEVEVAVDVETEGGPGVVRAEIETGGYTVDVFVEKLSDGNVGFRFLKPR